jgi:predicted alpha/beta-fold hydrolase
VIETRPPSSDFRPLPWLSNRHAQTIWASVCRRAPRATLTPERLELDDGDFLDIFWGPRRDNGPVVLLLHGLGGCARSPYMLGLTEALSARGYQCVILQYRGAGAPNRRQRFYFAADTADPARVGSIVAERFPERPLYAVGVSLGASMLLNWLAQDGADCAVERAAAISPPFDLGACADAINRGFARVYQRHLLNELKGMYAAKFPAGEAPVPQARVQALPSLRAFDDVVTAPFHGFRDAVDYYNRCSCGPRLGAIANPCLILHAQDDPFIPARTIPARETMNEAVRLVTPRRGGHVGFIGRDRGVLTPFYWAEATATAFLADGSGGGG